MINAEAAMQAFFALPTKERANLMLHFDPAHYLAQNPDVAKDGNTAQNAFNHFVLHGRGEHRDGGLDNANYLAQHPDVAAAYQSQGPDHLKENIASLTQDITGGNPGTASAYKKIFAAEMAKNFASLKPDTGGGTPAASAGQANGTAPSTDAAVADAKAFIAQKALLERTVPDYTKIPTVKQDSAGGTPAGQPAASTAEVSAQDEILVRSANGTVTALDPATAAKVKAAISGTAATPATSDTSATPTAHHALQTMPDPKTATVLDQLTFMAQNASSISPEETVRLRHGFQDAINGIKAGGITAGTKEMAWVQEKDGSTDGAYAQGMTFVRDLAQKHNLFGRLNDKGVDLAAMLTKDAGLLPFTLPSAKPGTVMEQLTQRIDAARAMFGSSSRADQMIRGMKEELAYAKDHHSTNSDLNPEAAAGHAAAKKDLKSLSPDQMYYLSGVEATRSMLDDNQLAGELDSKPMDTAAAAGPQPDTAWSHLDTKNASVLDTLTDYANQVTGMTADDTEAMRSGMREVIEEARQGKLTLKPADPTMAASVITPAGVSTKPPTPEQRKEGLHRLGRTMIEDMIQKQGLAGRLNDKGVPAAEIFGVPVSAKSKETLGKLATAATPYQQIALMIDRDRTMGASGGLDTTVARLGTEVARGMTDELEYIHQHHAVSSDPTQEAHNLQAKLAGAPQEMSTDQMFYLAGIERVRAMVVDKHLENALDGKALDVPPVQN